MGGSGVGEARDDGDWQDPAKVSTQELPGGARTTASYEYAGTPDELQRLWTPHRMAYITSDDRPPVDGAPPGEGADSQCPFCAGPHKADEDALIARRGELAYVVLNLYPYNGGHLLVCPYRHVADYTDLTDDERAEVGELTQQSMRVLRGVSRPQGFNLGMNQGQAGGAGIAAHLHQHVVPRFVGDANFLPIIGRTKAVPQLLGDLRALLARNWDTYCRPTGIAHPQGAPDARQMRG